MRDDGFLKKIVSPRAIFSVIVSLVFAAVFGPAVFAQFARQTGPVGWEDGFGYGYGFGYGWDGGASAGTRDTGDNLDQFGYGFGYGLSLPRSSNSELGAYNPATNRYEIASSDAPSLLQAGLIVPAGGDINNTTQIRFFGNVQIDAGGPIIQIADGTTMTTAEDTNFANLAMSDAADTTGLPADQTVRGEMQMGLPDLGLTVNPAVTIKISVSSSLNGHTLKVFSKEPGGEWAQLTTCVVADSYCTFTTSDLSEFAATSTAGGGGGGTSAPTITVADPNGGESLDVDTNHTIFWGSSGNGITGVRISLSRDSGANYTVLSANETNDGSYNWFITGPATTHARIKAEALKTGGIVGATDESDNDFSIVAPPEQGGGGGENGGGGGGGGVTPPPTGGENQGAQGQPSIHAGLMSRSDANKVLPPTVPVDSLVKLPGFDTVYYIGLDAKRHPFMTLPIFMSWYQNFSDVHIVDGPTLASIPLGNPILVRPGTHLVKIVSDPKTYYVEPGYKLRWVHDEATAQALVGPGWNRDIIDIDPTLFILFTVGEPITMDTLFAGWPAAAVLKEPNSPNIWYTTGTGRRLFTSMDAFTANNFQLRFVRNNVSTGWLSLPIENPIIGFEDGLFSVQH